MRKNKRVYIMIALILLLIVLFSPTFTVQAAEIKGGTNVTIKVLGNDTNLPLPRAYVQIVDKKNASNFWFGATDQKGSFKAVLQQDRDYFLYAFYDNATTRGIDYVPALDSIHTPNEEVYEIEIMLIPGATIFAQGSLVFPDSSVSVPNYYFTVVDPNGENRTFPLGDGIVVYGMNVYNDPPERRYQNDFFRRIGLSSAIIYRTIMVPANYEVGVKVAGFRTSGGVTRIFIIENITLVKGGYAEINLYSFSVNFCLQELEDQLSSLKEDLGEAEAAGFYVKAEWIDYNFATSLMNESLRYFNRNMLDESYGVLRVGYTRATETRRKVQQMFETAYNSALGASILIAFLSIALGFIFFESSHYKISLGALSFFLLETIFYFIFPGYRIVPIYLLGLYSAVAFLATSLILHILSEKEFSPKTTQPMALSIKAAATSIFSIAKRNIRRRRFRSFLLFSSLLVFSFSFILLTSVSPEYGLVTRSIPGVTSTIDGVYINKMGAFGSSTPFLPLDAEMVEWTAGRSEVETFAPRADNRPFTFGFNLYLTLVKTSKGDSIPIFGLVGIDPHGEAETFGLDNMVAEGRYFNDDERGVILISAEAAREFNVTLNEKISLYGFNFTLIGTFDDRQISNLRDINGQNWAPIYLQMSPIGLVPVPAEPKQFVILPLKDALNLPSVIISRISVKLKSSDLILGFSELVVSAKGYDATASIDHRLYQVEFGDYFEILGVNSLMVPLIIILVNVFSTFVANVYERKKEIYTMATVGLNPSHISVTFLAESTILGIMGGGLGYILGVSGYRTLAPLLGLALREKVSAEWGLVSVIFTMVSAWLGSLLPAMKSSTIATPSQLKRWSLSEQSDVKRMEGTWIMDLPTKIKDQKIEPFVAFFKDSLEQYEGMSARGIENLREFIEATSNGPIRVFRFKYYESADQSFSAENEVRLIRRDYDDFYSVQLICKPVFRNLPAYVHRNGSFIRKILLEWTEHVKIESIERRETRVGSTFS